MRFSLRWLFVAILLIAVSVVALLNANLSWANAAERARLLLFSVTIIGAIYSRASTRAFWIGAIVFGWIQMKPPVQQIDDRLLTFAHSLIVQEHVTVIDGRPSINWLPKHEYFVAVGDCVQSVFVACLGGVLAMWFHRRHNSRVEVERESG
jgi:hypothetical protein